MLLFFIYMTDHQVSPLPNVNQSQQKIYVSNLLCLNRTKTHLIIFKSSHFRNINRSNAGSKFFDVSVNFDFEQIDVVKFIFIIDLQYRHCHQLFLDELASIRPMLSVPATQTRSSTFSSFCCLTCQTPKKSVSLIFHAKNVQILQLHFLIPNLLNLT